MSTLGNSLSAAALIEHMSASLPDIEGELLKSPYEAIALAVHACMIAVGFRLVGLGEDDSIDVPLSKKTLPAKWNTHNTIGFRYSHDQSSMQYVIKIGRLGSSATVDAIAIGHDKRTSFDIPVQDYISASSLPLSRESGAQDNGPQIKDIFISQGRLGDLAALVKTHILQKLAPGIQKEGYEEEPSSSSTATNTREQRPQPSSDSFWDEPQPSRNSPQPNPYGIPDPALARPRVPAAGERPPGFEDEYDIYRRPNMPLAGGHMPRIGHDDLYPAGMGPNDPFRGGGGPLRGGPGESGMYPSPDDILFGGDGQGQQGLDPRAPPGARYDPTFPGDPLARGGFGRGGRGGFGGGGGGGFGGDII